ncbi:hypothetical protein, unlikely [Trypanosoma brucei gambiense DAL972]|uniref:Uncharacterized protein n=1 Tax=Trypanosoma brucei gambiense (strain MHOM/CI/86/DAL972) TaxID=679716 RepID=C9ZQ94_TRYB9|nr:hypothetical protein, unlikely [Trypanosoma brucei gambiense DAL972]CBH11574.1 hypothetical protein, unlikely [Trypanosoma brucei gambiense DAL972]|eukprot:XP_011773859.1 hypothetical protein, unlikely [Trypanosoma brucei gambiense DAL972]
MAVVTKLRSNTYVCVRVCVWECGRYFLKKSSSHPPFSHFHHSSSFPRRLCGTVLCYAIQIHMRNHLLIPLRKHPSIAFKSSSVCCPRGNGRSLHAGGTFHAPKCIIVRSIDS